MHELVNYLAHHYQSVDVTTFPPDQPATAWFFSLDREKHLPNFATIVRLVTAVEANPGRDA